MSFADFEKQMKEFEKQMKEIGKRNKEIENLALSIVGQMTKLGLTLQEYQMLKDKLDKLVESSKITI